MRALRKPLSAPAWCLLSLTLPDFQYGQGITTMLVFVAPFWGRAEHVVLISSPQAKQQASRAHYMEGELQDGAAFTGNMETGK